MDKKQTHAITGAFGYTGKYIARKLIDDGQNVITLTNSLNRENPFKGKIKAFPFNFDNPEKLIDSLKGVYTLYNTYWVRFNHKVFTHSEAVRNTLALFQAAKKAGVKKIVHVSITNPSIDSDLEYFRDKAFLEKELIKTGISYSILRPAVIFGKEDILINNIAWFLRSFPIFGMPGRGDYRLQPIFVGDLAELAIKEAKSPESKIINAIGPETFTYKELVETIGKIINKPRRTVPLPPLFIYLIGTIASLFTKDVIVTKEEIKGLMAGTLVVDSPATGKAKFIDWCKNHADSIGKKYTSELARRRDRINTYATN